MNPPPRISNRRGTSSTRMIVSEVWNGVPARPGMSGITGDAPAASTTWSAVMSVTEPSAAVTRSVRSPVKRPSPANNRTFDWDRR